MTQHNRNQRKYTADLHDEYGVFGDYMLTRNGSLIGAIEISGYDADSLGGDDLDGLSNIARSIYQNLPETITITQYYSHLRDLPIKLRDRDDDVSSFLSSRREAHINALMPSGSKIIHFFEIKPNENIGKINLVALLRNITKNGLKNNFRDIVGTFTSLRGTSICFAEALQYQYEELSRVIDEVQAKYSQLFDVCKLNINEIWNFTCYIARLDRNLLHSTSNPPEVDWDVHLTDGDRSHVLRDGMDLIKLHGAEHIYARIGSITRYGTQNIPPSIWVSDDQNPVNFNSDFVIMQRFVPLSKVERAFLFTKGQLELSRRNISISNILSGNTSSEEFKYMTMRPAVSEQMKELQHAEMVEDRWGKIQSTIVLFNKDVQQIKEDSVALKTRLDNCDISWVWENLGIRAAYKNFQVAGKNYSLRAFHGNTGSYGAISLLYRATKGQVRVKDLNEEAQYVFQSEDGTPFHFSPFVGGRAMLFGVGPTRSGKSFFKNTVASHFMKYDDSFYRALDVDAGTEALAAAFGDDGAVFRVGQDEVADKGFNPFYTSEESHINIFSSHLRGLIIQMLSTNDTKSMQELLPNEQRDLDYAIKDILEKDPIDRSFGELVAHLGHSLESKLERWIKDGMYAGFFDNDTDVMGDALKRLMVFNLASVRSTKHIMPIIMSEIFFRITTTFESKLYMNKPKYLDIDEAHILLKVDYIRKYLVEKVRTWGKYKAGIGMWSQSPKEFLDIPDWDALRSSASTMIFMADPNMNQDLYQQAFNLSVGECELIRRLRPQREALILQPELKISKKVILDVEPEQYVIVTSNPDEVMLRDNNIRSLGFNKGITKTVEDLRVKNIS